MDPAEDVRFELTDQFPDHGLAIRCNNHSANLPSVPPRGFEPLTFCSVNKRSSAELWRCGDTGIRTPNDCLQSNRDTLSPYPLWVVDGS